MDVITFDLISGLKSARPYTKQELTEISRVDTTSAADVIHQQIIELESQQTHRRIREAALGIDDGWLAALNDQIVDLRTQLRMLDTVSSK